MPSRNSVTKKGDPDTEILKYIDPALPVEKRVADLLSRMTLEEKEKQMNQVFAIALAEGNTALTKEKPVWGSGFLSVERVFIATWAAGQQFSPRQ